MMKLSLRHSKFLVRYSAVQGCGNSDKVSLDCFSPESWILASDSFVVPSAHCLVPSKLKGHHVLCLRERKMGIFAVEAGAR
jgi:hypothetical protein